MNVFVILLEKVSGRDCGQDTILRHIDHLKRLESQDHLIMCGPFSDYPGGMIVVNARNLEEAEMLAEQDPFVIEGFRKFEVRSWMIATKVNRYLV